MPRESKGLIADLEKELRHKTTGLRLTVLVLRFLYHQRPGEDTDNGMLQSRKLVCREACGLGDLLENGTGALSKDKIAVYR